MMTFKCYMSGLSKLCHKHVTHIYERFNKGLRIGQEVVNWTELGGFGISDVKMFSSITIQFLSK
jgi:hypothetical protein